jgi:hypothetical protein
MSSRNLRACHFIEHTPHSLLCREGAPSVTGCCELQIANLVVRQDMADARRRGTCCVDVEEGFPGVGS